MSASETGFIVSRQPDIVKNAGGDFLTYLAAMNLTDSRDVADFAKMIEDCIRTFADSQTPDILPHIE